MTLRAVNENGSLGGGRGDETHVGRIGVELDPHVPGGDHADGLRQHVPQPQLEAVPVGALSSV